MAVTTKQLNDLRETFITAKETCIKARATYDELVKTIDTQKEELKALGINPDNFEVEIEKIQSGIDAEFTKYSNLYESIKPLIQKLV